MLVAFSAVQPMLSKH